MSRFWTLRAFFSMNSRLGSTSSPIRVLKIVIGVDGVFDFHLQDLAGRGVHGGLP